MCKDPKQTPKEDIKYERLASKHQQLAQILYSHLTNKSTSSLTREHSAASYAELKALIRVIGGVPAAPGEFNECCLVGTRNSMGHTRWFCTGVLIHPGIVVTAAHCIKPGRAYEVRLGINDMNNSLGGEKIAVRKVIVHPQYHSGNHLNDIAVLILQAKAQTSPVPPASTARLIQAGEVMLVGFGNDEMTGTTGFGTKRKVEVDILSIRQDPGQDLSDDEALYEYESDLEFVAGGAGFDTCTGDSGGPVYIMEEGRRSVAGLTSRAVGNSVHPCGDGGIYTRLDVHAAFINNYLH